MSRKIKFRAWDNETKEMHTSSFSGNYISFGGLIRNGSIQKNWVLTQFTNLEDKNEKEIYEGDIYCYPNDFPKSAESTPFEISEVIFSEGAFRIGDYLLSEYKEEGEVIGNIFENPELLEDSYE